MSAWKYPWPYSPLSHFNTFLFPGIAPALVELFGHRDISHFKTVLYSGIAPALVELFGHRDISHFKTVLYSGIAPALVELFGHRDISLKYSLCLSGELFGCGLFYLLSVLSVSVYDDFVSAISYIPLSQSPSSIFHIQFRVFVSTIIYVIPISFSHPFPSPSLPFIICERTIAGICIRLTDPGLIMYPCVTSPFHSAVHFPRICG